MNCFTGLEEVQLVYSLGSSEEIYVAGAGQLLAEEMCIVHIDVLRYQFMCVCMRVCVCACVCVCVSLVCVIAVTVAECIL